MRVTSTVACLAGVMLAACGSDDVTAGPAATITALSGPTAAVVGQSITFSAAVSVAAAGSSAPAASAVTFKDGASTLSCNPSTVTSNVATCTTTITSAGTHSISAVFGGQLNYSASTSAAISLSVLRASTSVTVSSSAASSTVGQSVTFTAVVGVTAPGTAVVPVSGSVFFTDGSTVLKTCMAQYVVNGSTICTASTLGVGTHNITAFYLGDANYFPSPPSAAVSQAVRKGTPTVTVTAAQTGGAGSAVQFTISVAGANNIAPTGVVSVTAVGTSAVITTCTLSGTTANASCSTSGTVSPGTSSFTASYPGDGSYAAATGTSAAVTVQSISHLLP